MQIGIVGLGTMGRALAENLLDNGVRVSGWNLETPAVEALARARREFEPAANLASLLQTLETPRAVLLMVPAGDAVDSILEQLATGLDDGDVVIDAGNSHYLDTERRAARLEAAGVQYVGLGVSGGEAGARHGPSMMFGGSLAAWTRLNEPLTRIAATSAFGACVNRVGPAPAGHFVKMLHNGIEYADMQLIAEAYDLMLRGRQMAPRRIAQQFAAWNSGPLQSFLVELTAQVLQHEDADTGNSLVSQILDKAGQKGTGRWSVDAALTLGVPAPTIGAAVDARLLSAQKAVRQQHAASYPPIPVALEVTDEELESALLCAKLFAYAQGFALLQEASRAFDWSLDLAEIARVWTGGCIIRAALLAPIRDFYAAAPPTADLMRADFAKAVVAERASALRKVTALAQQSGLPVPALSASLAWFDGLRSATLPQNLIQAQRDAFGNHGFAHITSPDTTRHYDW